MKIRIYETLRKMFNLHNNREETSIDIEEVKTIMKNDIGATLVDVRSPQEYREGHLNRSINIPLYDLEKNCEEMLKDKNNTVILVCQSGSRSKKALKILQSMGYTSIYQLARWTRQYKLKGHLGTGHFCPLHNYKNKYIIKTYYNFM